MINYRKALQCHVISNLQSHDIWVIKEMNHESYAHIVILHTGKTRSLNFPWMEPKGLYK